MAKIHRSSRAHVLGHPSCDNWRSLAWWVCVRIPNFNPIGQAVTKLQLRQFLEIESWGTHVRVRGATPLFTPVEGWVDGYLGAYQI